MANLLEAGKLKLDSTGKKWSVTIIEGDRQGSSAFYPKEVLENDADKFEGRTRIYLNHPSESEKWDQPERRVQDIVGFVENGKYDGKDIVGEANILSKYRDDIRELAEAGLIGLSIRASGVVDESGTLTAFTKVHSVDLVTEAGAGGAFKEMLESNRKQESKDKGDSVMDEALKKALDELVEATKGNADALKVLAEAEKARAEKEAEALAEAERKEQEAQESAKPTAADIAGALVEAKLTKSAQARVLKAVDGGAELAEAIKEEQEYAAELLKEAEESKESFGSVIEEGKKEETSLASTVFRS